MRKLGGKPPIGQALRPERQERKGTVVGDRCPDRGDSGQGKGRHCRRARHRSERRHCNQKKNLTSALQVRDQLVVALFVEACRHSNGTHRNGTPEGKGRTCHRSRWCPLSVLCMYPRHSTFRLTLLRRERTCR